MNRALLLLLSVVIALVLSAKIGYADKKPQDELEKRITALEARVTKLEGELSDKVLPLRR